MHVGGALKEEHDSTILVLCILMHVLTHKLPILSDQETHCQSVPVVTRRDVLIQSRVMKEEKEKLKGKK